LHTFPSDEINQSLGASFMIDRCALRPRLVEDGPHNSNIFVGACHHLTMQVHAILVFMPCNKTILSLLC